MGVIKNEKVRGYHFYDGTFTEVVCPDCVREEDLENLTRDELLTEEDLEKSDRKFFCDRCGGEI